MLVLYYLGTIWFMGSFYQEMDSTGYDTIERTWENLVVITLAAMLWPATVIIVSGMLLWDWYRSE